VVKEERRMRTDSSPIGRMIEQFLGTDDFAFQPGEILFIGLSLSGI